jgi:F-box-like/Leucine Rich repeat
MCILPPDILLRIFPLLLPPALFNVVQVSKHWNSLAIPVLWRKPRFEGGPLSNYAPLFKIHGQFVHDVKLFRHNRPNKDDANLVVNTCTNLTSVEFCCTEITTEEISMLCERLSKQLKNLTIHCCTIVDEMSSLIAHIATLGKLKRLALTDMESIDDAACELVTVGCPLLEYLNLDHTTITDVGVRYISQRIPQIRSLSISACDDITNTSIITIIESCSLLTSIYVFGTKITDVAFSTVSFACCKENITTINLAVCANITNVGIRQVVTHFPHLQHLDISGCSQITDGLFDEPLWKCPELSGLFMDFLNVGSTTLFFISNMTSLTRLSLIGLKGEVSKHSLLSLTKIPKLRTLDICGYEFVDDDLKKKITEKSSLTHFYTGSSVWRKYPLFPW